MKLSTANNFMSVKKRVPILIAYLNLRDIKAINSILRSHFVGKEVDSIYCYKKNYYDIMVRMTKDTAITAFTFKLTQRRQDTDVTFTQNGSSL